MRSGLKMAGAKGPALMAQILPLLPQAEGPWAIPFFGIGSAARAMHGAGLEIGFCSDANAPLVAVLQALRHWPLSFLASAMALEAEVCGLGSAEAQREWYFERRAAANAAGLSADPALFLILWRLAFNGLMRVSRARGEFNPSPRIQPGKPVRSILDVDALTGFAVWLGQIPRVELAGYESTSEGPAYLDPPYVGTHDTYVRGGFDHGAYHRWLGARPGPWAASNSADAPGAYPLAYLHRPLYRIERRGTFSGKGDGRQPVGEILAVCL